LNLFTVLDQAAARFPDRGALYHGQHRLCTWLELRERALSIATTLRAQATLGRESPSPARTVPRSWS
jgi:fatty-acyl-CoA synthase